MNMAEVALPVATLMKPTPAAATPHTRVFPIEQRSILDKLGARLEFARTCARLYEALIPKLEAHGTFRGGPTRRQLERFRDEELGHEVVVERLMTRLGGDPTVPTGSANRQAAVTGGLVELIEAPQTSLIDSLDALVVAELVNHETWRQLLTMMAPLGEVPVGAQVREIERSAAEHLAAARAWMVAAVANAAKQVH
jgi:hypothetical protein